MHGYLWKKNIKTNKNLRGKNNYYLKSINICCGFKKSKLILSAIFLGVSNAGRTVRALQV
jgi:hypothetical protein